jgi:hypothetical protein
MDKQGAGILFTFILKSLTTILKVYCIVIFFLIKFFFFIILHKNNIKFKGIWFFSFYITFKCSTSLRVESLKKIAFFSINLSQLLYQ